ncbi:MAG TPA: cupin domain-containing protein [bacterium]|nr:cupin domain-containing protein [bacterium]HMW36718.1 cupin domain-containing protein [bacterium]HMY36644.1 cupin domain-containing protein [bacterium]HMZ05273.1 cupin domain-containing protein [bacterium]HNB09996.1 cupin domain-containing protein [bacterium]
MSSDRVIEINTDSVAWESSDSKGVFYKSLRYDKETKAGAVLIRMEPGSDYPEHEHTRGEDFIVLEGELIIGNKTFPAQSYVYSPPQSVHHPRTEKGCVLFAVFHGKIINLK